MRTNTSNPRYKMCYELLDLTGNSCQKDEECAEDHYCEEKMVGFHDPPYQHCSTFIYCIFCHPTIQSRRCRPLCRANCLCGLYGVTQDEANRQCASKLCNMQYFFCYRNNPSSPMTDPPYKDMVTRYRGSREKRPFRLPGSD